MKNLIFLFIPLMIVLFSCADDDESNISIAPNAITITDLASADNDLSILVEALQRTDLDEALDNQNGDFTVFAPTNTAFLSLLQELGLNSLDEVSNDNLSKILLNHVLGQSKMAAELVNGYETVLAEEATTGNQLNMYINISTSGVMLNGRSTVSDADIMADNGVIHKIDKVATLPTVVTFATTNPDFSLLVEAVTRPSFGTTYTDLLSGTTDGPFTVFAPTNHAFSSLLSELDINQLSEVSDAVLMSILNYHVIANANVLSSNLEDDMAVTTFGGESFTVNLGNNNPQLIDASGRVSDIIATDVQANNGVIHVIDRVVLPMSDIEDTGRLTITETAERDSELSIFSLALERTGLDVVLNQQEQEFTVMAPTNEAFRNFFTSIGVNGLSGVPNDLLESKLLNHVFADSRRSNDFYNGYKTVLAVEETTNNPINVFVEVNGGQVTFNENASFTESDIRASNGIIHKVDGVITLPQVLTFVRTDSRFSILEEALTRISFNRAYTNLLSDTENGPFTVFAPTNDAFEALFDELGIGSLRDINDQTLINVLNYHVVTNANVLSNTLTDDMEIATFGNQSFTIDLDLDIPLIVDNNNRVTNIIFTDLQSENGVIHAINKVLLP